MAMPRPRLLILLLASLLCQLRPAAAATSVLHVVVDDLGRADLGFRNGNVTHSPTLDMMARAGVILDAHHVFQVCAPTRASILTGRYPWGIGFYYVGGDNLGVPLGYEMLPAALQRLGKAQKGLNIATAAIGKWHCGGLFKAHTPTYRGFDSYFGYYHAAVNSYWYHGGEGGGCEGTDLSNSTGQNGQVRGATRPDINGTYSTLAFAAEAERIIHAHNTADPLYIYVAFEAVHDAGGKGVTAPVQAPLRLVERYSPLIADDTYKVQAAMIASLDSGVANITQALQRKGMLDEAVFIVVADNGGPLDHSCVPAWQHHHACTRTHRVTEPTHDRVAQVQRAFEGRKAHSLGWRCKGRGLRVVQVLEPASERCAWHHVVWNCAHIRYVPATLPCIV
jgi:arylsulfatase B